MTYKAPTSVVEQIFNNESTTITTPVLLACIVGPGYQMVSAYDNGEYNENVGADQEFDYASKVALAQVDIRTTETVTDESDDDELAYPLTVLLDDAQVRLHSYAAAPSDGSIAANSQTIIEGTGTPFADYDSDYIHYIQLRSGAYTHDVYTPATGGLTLGFISGTDTTTADIEGYVELPAQGYACSLDIGRKIRLVIGGLGDIYEGTVTAIDATGLAGQTAGTYAVQFEDFGSATSPNILFGALPVTTDTGTGAFIWNGMLGVDGLLDAEKTLRKLTSVTNNTTAVIANQIPYGVAYANLTYDVYRVSDETFTIDDFAYMPTPILADADKVTLPYPLTISDKGWNIVRADVKLTYRALRKNMADNLFRNNDDAAIATNIGAVQKENTAAWAIHMALLNSNGRPVYYSGIDERHFSTSTRDLAYSDAFSYVADYRMYNIVPTTMRPTVTSLLKTHVDAQSSTDESNWRVGTVCRKLQEFAEQASGTCGETFVGPVYEGLTGTSFADANGEFVTDDVEAGDVLVVKEWTGVTPDWDASATPLVATVELISGSGPNADESAVTLKLTAATNIMTILAPKVQQNIAFLSGTFYDNTSDDADTVLYTDASHTRNDARDPSINGKYFSSATGTTYFGFKISSVEAVDGTGTVVFLTLERATDTLISNAALGTNAIASVAFGSCVLTTSQEADLTKTAGWTVDSVTNERLLTLSSAPIPSSFTGTYNGITYSIRRAWTETEQCQYIGAYATGIADRRIRLTWPDRFLDSDSNELWGYFFSAACAGWVSGNPPQKPMTRSYILGPYALQNSNDEFKKDELNEMADGGVAIFTQTSPGVNPQCRHQLSTDRTTIYYQEWSITHSVDTASFLLKDQFDPLVGIYNITQDLFTTITSKAESIKTELTETSVKPRIGSTLRDFTLLSASRDPNNIDQALVSAECVPQVPCNKIITTLTVN